MLLLIHGSRCVCVWETLRAYKLRHIGALDVSIWHEMNQAFGAHCFGY